MGSHPVFKTVDEYSQQTFKAYKTWTLTESTIGQYNSSVNEAVYVSSSLLVDLAGTNPSGISKRSLFSTLYNMYYQYPKLPYNALGGNAQLQDRDISGRAVVVSISNDYIGERIKPGSITITDSSTGSIVIKDDGFGNLYNSSDSTAYVPSASLYGHWSFNEGFIISGNVGGGGGTASIFENENHVFGRPKVRAFNVTYTGGVFGTRINFDGSSASYAVVDDYRDINFRTNEDFAISVWVWVPATQPMRPVVANSILEKWDCNGGYPFIIRVFNGTWGTAGERGKIYCATHDTINGSYLTSSAQLNDNLPHHIVYQRQGATYQLYVDGASNGSATVNLEQTHNNSKLYIGARGYEFAPSGAIYNFKGGIDELRIYSGSLSAAQITTLYSKPSNTNIVGNAFYAHGILALTNLSGSYSSVMLSGSRFVMTYKSTVSITENNVLASVMPSEFNMTTNPSCATVYDTNDQVYLPIVTGSDWSPYVTTLGMYDDDLNLLAVAKFTKPIKKPVDAPITFAIRWDS